MIKAVLFKMATKNETVNRIYNTIALNFEAAGIQVETRPKLPAAGRNVIASKDVFIVAVLPDSLNDKNWIAGFDHLLAQVRSNEKKLLIPLIIDQATTEPFFQERDLKEWLPVEDDPQKFYEDISWMIERIGTFAQAQGLATDPNLQTSSKKVTASYWLLKINEQTWQPDTFEKGKRFHFNADHHQGVVQSDYPYFQQLKTGDLLIVLSLPDTQDAVAIMRVTKPLYGGNNKSQLVNLIVDSLITPPIKLSELADLPFYNRLNYEANEKLYPLDRNFAEQLLASRRSGGGAGAKAVSSQSSAITSISNDMPLASVEDELGIMADVNAIASVIAYKEVPLPLSIGLFGNWGSGKSFFMQKVEEAVADLEGSDSAIYCEGIVPVWFNSWHYSDANLWASLSCRIFDVLSEYGRARNPKQLEALFSQLHSTNEQAELARLKAEQAGAALTGLSSRLQQNQKIIDEKVSKLETAGLVDITLKIFQSQKFKNKLEEIGEKADFVNWDDLSDVKIEAERIRTAGGEAWAVVRQAYGLTKGKFWKAVAAFTGVYLLLGVAEHYLPYLKDLSAQLHGLIQWAGVVLAQLSLFIAPAMKAVNKVSGKLRELGDVIKDVQKDEREKLNGRLSGLKAEIAAAEAEKKGLTAQQEQLQVKKALIEAEIADIRQGKKVISFIEARVTDERYVKNLGMISWVRKDFEMLELLLKQQREAATVSGKAGDFYINRIVLYIDDLDRCREETVVQLLEAIHLLLAIPLFVVIVGVDPKWMENSLMKQFEGLLMQDSETAASPMIYLEKIFQIPFRLQAVNDNGFRDLVASQFSAPETGAEQPSEKVKIATDTMSAGVRETPSAPHPVVPAVNSALLIISLEEIAFMQQLNKLIPPSPRTIKRYINIYRIIRSHTDLQFAADDRMSHYRAVMILLAVLVGTPLQVKPLLRKLDAIGDDGSFEEFLRSLKNDKDLAAIAANLLAIVQKISPGIALSCFKLNTSLIERFTFH